MFCSPLFNMLEIYVHLSGVLGANWIVILLDELANKLTRTCCAIQAHDCCSWYNVTLLAACSVQAYRCGELFHRGGHRAVMTATVISSDILNRSNFITYHTCTFFFLVNAFKLWSHTYNIELVVLTISSLTLNTFILLNNHHHPSPELKCYVVVTLL